MSNQFTLPKISWCGRYDSRSVFSTKRSPLRIVTTFEIEYFLEDGKNTYIDEVPYPIRRNFVLLCFPGEKRYSDLPFKTKSVKFSADGKIAEILSKTNRYFHVSKNLDALSLLDEIITLYATEKDNDLPLYGKLLTFLSLLIDTANQTALGDAYQVEIVERAREFISKHYHQPIKLCDIASAVNLSPNYFHTVFTKNCKQTPRQYLEDFRIGETKKLLLSTRLSLAEIAERCGFETQQYLTAVFKSKTGYSPAQFKRQHQSAYLL